MDLDAQLADAEERLWRAYLELKDATEQLDQFPGYVPDPEEHRQVLAQLRKAEARFAPRMTLEFIDPYQPPE